MKIRTASEIPLEIDCIQNHYNLLLQLIFAHFLNGFSKGELHWNFVGFILLVL